MDTVTTNADVKISPLDSPEVAAAKIAKVAGKKTGKSKPKKVKASSKKVAAKTGKKTGEKKSRRAFSDADVAKHLSKLTTVTMLAKQLKVTKPAAQNYLNALKKIRKVETKEIRQGKRGPLAIAYRLP